MLFRESLNTFDKWLKEKGRESLAKEYVAKSTNSVTWSVIIIGKNNQGWPEEALEDLTPVSQSVLSC